MGLASSFRGASGKAGGLVIKIVKAPLTIFKGFLRFLGKAMTSVGLGGVAQSFGWVSDKDYTGSYTGDSKGILGLIGKVVSAPVKIPTIAVNKTEKGLDKLSESLLGKIKK